MKFFFTSPVFSSTIGKRNGKAYLRGEAGIWAQTSTGAVQQSGVGALASGELAQTRFAVSKGGGKEVVVIVLNIKVLLELRSAGFARELATIFVSLVVELHQLGGLVVGQMNLFPALSDGLQKRVRDINHNFGKVLQQDSLLDHHQKGHLGMVRGQDDL